jgi:hypothetical protein
MSNIRKPKTGDRFTRLLVLNTFLLKEKNGLKRTTRVVCLCDCGREKVVRAASLKKGETKSCGCLAKNSVGGVSSHKHPLYKTWKNMRSRCNNPNLPEYKDYGGRGLKVTQRWDDFPRFVKDMGPKPTPSHTIDRIWNDGNYTPENCKWATRRDQANNRRSNVLLTHNGVTRTAFEWSRHLGGANQLVSRRLRLGWTIERALTTPTSSSTWMKS